MLKIHATTVGTESQYLAKSLYSFSAATVFIPPPFLYPYIIFWFFFFLIFLKYSPFSTIPQLFSTLPIFLGFFKHSEENMFLKSVISIAAANAVNIKYLKILKTDFCHTSIHQPPFAKDLWASGETFLRKLTLKSDF